MSYSRLRERSITYHRLTKIIDKIDERRIKLPVESRGTDPDLNGMYVLADRLALRLKQLT